MSGGKSDEVTIGYKYHIGAQIVLCQGHIDQVQSIKVDGRLAWQGPGVDETITIDAPDLFGGDEREGGVSGDVDIESGLPSQGKNAYLQSQLGDDVPSFRGVSQLVLNQCYMGNNPYLKPWAVMVQRIHKTTDGETQWYDAKAEITNDGCGVYACDAIQAYAEANELWHWPLLDGSPGIRGSTVPSAWAKQDNPPVDQPNLVSSQAGNAWDNQFGRMYYATWSDQDITPCYETPYALRGIDYGGSYSTPTNSISPAPDWNARGGFGTAFAVIIRSMDNDLNVDQVIWRATATLRYWVAPTPTVSGSSDGFLVSVRRYNNGSGNVEQIRLVDDDTHANVILAQDLPDGTLTGSTPKTVGVLASFQGFSYRNPTSSLGGTSFDVYAVYDYIKLRVGDSLFEFNNVAYFRISTWDPAPYSGPGQEIDPAYEVYYSGSETDRYLHQFQGIYHSLTINETDWTPDSFAALMDAYDQNLTGYSPEDTCCGDMNPAHIIRECLTDPDWGLGFSSAEIDDDSFMYAADTLYTESLGLSLIWKREESLEDFIGEILRHIDAALYVSRQTGKFVLKLIRDDSSETDMLVLDEDSNVVEVKDINRPAISELTSSITVNFWDRETEKEASVTEHNQALTQIQGGITHTTINYPGITTRTNASRLCQRDMRALSTPLIKCSVIANREADALNIGDAFILNAPTRGINSVVMRVERITFGDGVKNAIQIDASEDVYRLPSVLDATVGNGEDDIWIDPVEVAPLASEPRLITEAPYYRLVQRIGELDINTILDDDNDAGFLMAAGGRQGSEINARLEVDTGTGYAKGGVLDFCPVAYLAGDISYTDETIYLTSEEDIDLVETPSIAQIGDELVRVDSVDLDSNGYYITVGRGILDTTPQVHTADSNPVEVLFWGYATATDGTQYVASDSVDVRLRTKLGANILAAADTPEDTVVMDSRAIRPYPPGNLRIDGASYPVDDSNTVEWDAGVNVEWSHRDRLQQTDGNYYDYTEGDIGPEAGTEYIVRCLAYDENGALIGEFIEDYVGNTTTWGFDSNTDSNWGSDFNSAPDDAAEVKIEVWSTRDGYESWQAAHVTIPVAGGVVENARTLEDGTTRLLEDGTTRVLED